MTGKQGKGVQVSEQVDQRLRQAEIIWLTTVRGNGQPQPVPVWFLWDGQAFLIYSQPDQAKLRNIRDNPRVALNLNSDPQGGTVTRLEGNAEIDKDAPLATVVQPFVAKYAAAIQRIGMDPETFAREYSVAIRVTPTRVSAF